MQRSSAPPGRARSLAGALTLAVVLAACGSGADSTGASPSPAVSAGQPGDGAATPSSATPPTLPGGTATSAGGGSAATRAPADPNAPRLDADVLQGQAVTIEGTSFDLGSLAGKDLVVWFWAPW